VTADAVAEAAFDPKGEKAQGYQGKFGTTAPSYAADRLKTVVGQRPQELSSDLSKARLKTSPG
jgi:hypothetical protein